jgi:hypothetical protein
MDEGFSLARKEEERRTMLLARTSTSKSNPATPHRDKRQKGYGFGRRAKSSQTEDTTEESKDSSVDKDRSGQGGRGKKHRQNNKARDKARAVERRYKAGRRSAEQLGIEWFDSYCPDKPTPPHAHFMIELIKLEAGSIFQCRYCERAKWLPGSMDEAMLLGYLMKDVGDNEAYQYVLGKHPVAMVMVAKLQDIRLLKGTMSQDDYMRVVAAIITDKTIYYQQPTEDK